MKLGWGWRWRLEGGQASERRSRCRCAHDNLACVRRAIADKDVVRRNLALWAPRSIVRGYCGATLVGGYAKRRLRNDVGVRSLTFFRICEQVWKTSRGIAKLGRSW